MPPSKLLFIIPPCLPLSEYNPKGIGQKIPVLTPPYGVLSMISYINKDNKHDINVFDINEYIIHNQDVDDWDIIDELHARIDCHDIICISALFNTCQPHLKYIVSSAKRFSPKSLILVGGGLATNSYVDLFHEIPGIDACCYGEGELPLLKLLTAPIYPENMEKLSRAWITPRTLQKGIQPEFDFIENLDEIPVVDFGCIDIKKYNGRSYINKDNPDKVEISIHTSRGCPYNCIYCANGAVHGKKIRRMSESFVLRTIEEYIIRYEIDILMIEDDHFLANKARAIRILDKIREFNIDVEFPNGIAVYQVNDDVAEAFSRCNVKVVPLAIESGSDYVLREIIDKPLHTEQIYSAVAALRRYDIRIHAFVIIGFPGEFDHHRQQTIDLLLDLEIDWVHVFIATPISGSRLHRECVEKGWLTSTDYNNYIVSKCNIRAPGVDPVKIEQFAYYINVVVNLIRNSNYHNKRYGIFEKYLKNIINNYPEEAFAYYMLCLVYQSQVQGYSAIAANYFTTFQNLIAKDDYRKAIIEKLKEDHYV
jgi:radical SAM superfamily enzyme YgiQ (UPF0313 family)